ncbi:MAG TPA: glycoside hydrolase family 97 protein [Pyrinomonadaceae bacterium]|nr:glycoside hydrolase family 97 protein [Pyrinomonadaceae bacterium]
MKRTRKLILPALVAACVLCVKTFAQTETPPLKLSSPDGRVGVALALAEDGTPVYSVTFNGREVIAPSTLGLEFKQGGLLAKGLRVTGSKRDSRDETFAPVVGKTSRARDHYNELTVSLEEQAAPGRRLELVFRAYDDGAAFRYRLPAEGWKDEFEMTAEHTAFRFPTDLDCWALQLGSFTTSYEGEFDRVTSGRIAPGAVVGLPLVCRTRDELATFALSEADLEDYAGLYFTGSGRGYGVRSLLSPRRDDKTVAVRARAGADGFRTPWRVVMLAGDAHKLIESNLVNALSPPSRVADTSWIKPGKAAWDWWSGRVVEGASFETGMNDATMKAYIDLASELGLEYMLVDAGWYSKLPEWGDKMDLKADLTKTIPEINLPELVRYARSKRIGLFVWAHWRLVNDQMDRAFPFFEQLGLKGVKIDFMDSDDQEMVAFYHRTLKKAAEHHLMVNFHGAYKPTGLARTYPNYLTQEGVLGAEYNKWSARVTATHNVTLAFTRLLLGPMDYTPGAFGNRARPSFEIKFVGPQVMTTRAHQLAMYVVYESPLACVSDSPGAYRGQAGADFLKAVPTTWDETRALTGEIGEYVVVARRRGRDWYVGAMTNERGREVRVPLSFLGGGAYRLTLYADGLKPEDVVTISGDLARGRLDGSDSMTLKLAPSGGAALIFKAR